MKKQPVQSDSQRHQIQKLKSEQSAHISGTLHISKETLKKDKDVQMIAEAYRKSGCQGMEGLQKIIHETLSRSAKEARGGVGGQRKRTGGGGKGEGREGEGTCEEEGSWEDVEDEGELISEVGPMETATV